MEVAAKAEEKGRAPESVEGKSAAAGGSGFKFNVDAPEFVPRSHSPMALSQAPAAQFPGCYYYNPWVFGGAGTVPPAAAAAATAADWWCFADQEFPLPLVPDFVRGSANGPHADTLIRLVKQVEYQFSDANLISSDYMMKLISKDPEGYVPIFALISQKKIKAQGSNSFMLAKALRASSKLVVSEDGKRVRRKNTFTEREKEDLQSRTVIVENLPEECSRQNLEKIFGTIGRVKSVRICHPRDPNSPRHSKADVLISNKLHALVEYESSDQADRAAEKLNDERNWREGLRVRVMLRRSPRSVMRNRKGDYDFFDSISDEDEQPSSEQGSPHSQKTFTESAEDSPTAAKRDWTYGRGKYRGVSQGHNGRGVLSPAPQTGSNIRNETPTKQSPRKQGTVDGTRGILSPSPQPQSEAGKQSPRGPRMPDGTRGFTMGRGKPLSPSLG